MLFQTSDFFKSFGEYSATRNPAQETTTIIGVAIALVLLVIGYFIFRRLSQNATGGLRRQSKQHGLDRDQYRILKKSVKQYSISNLDQLFSSPGFLNGVLRKLILEIDQSKFAPAEKESLKGEIFEIKRLITINHKNAQSTIPSTKNISIGQEVLLFSKSFPPIHSAVSGKTETTIMIDHPRDSHGELVQFKRGTQFKVRFVRDSEKIYSFVAALDEMREIEGTPRLLLPHTDKIQRVQLRRNKRKEFNRTAFFYKVNILTEGRGRKQTRRAVVDRNKRFSGTFADISAGGCGIVTRSALPKGAALLLQFDVEAGESAQVHGRVRGLRRQRNGVLLMHVLFTKIDQKTRNKINAIVYDLDDDGRRRGSIGRSLID